MNAAETGAPEFKSNPLVEMARKVAAMKPVELIDAYADALADYGAALQGATSTRSRSHDRLSVVRAEILTRMTRPRAGTVRREKGRR